MIRWNEYLHSYIPTVLTWSILSMLLALPNYSITSAFFQTLFILSWSYWGHRIAHMISADYPFNLLNPHVSIHHDHVIHVPRWLNLVLEGFVDFMCFFILCIIQYITGIHIISTSLILGAAFLYVCIHIFDYSIIGRHEHILHHKLTFCNYDPEFMDTLFGTRCEDTPYKNMNHEIIHAIYAFILAMLLKVRFNLD